jgi:pimeloyl-ACP methyl ester carboxylesterase
LALAGLGWASFGWALGGLVLAIWLGAAWQLAERIGVVWLFRSIRFTHGLARVRDTTLRQRVEELTERLLELEEQDPADEVWLVGHSSGSFVMAMLAAELRRRGTWPALAGRLRMLSLGQNLANLAVHQKATGFHADLGLVAEEPRVPWLDITSPDDYLCFAGVDPYASCGVPCQVESYPELRLIPLAQRQQLITWWALVSHQFDLHFEYLRTAEPGQSGGFDLYEFLLAPVGGGVKV